MNRPTELAAALRALEACDPKPAEILVSDDSPASDRRSEDVCRQFRAVKYQVGLRSGLSANRNACVAASAGKWLHFTDDDLIVPADFYSRAAKVLAIRGDRSVVSGCEWKYEHGPDAPPALMQPQHSGFWAHMRNAEKQDANCVVINAAVFPRELFRTARFDERLKYGCEESDITLQAIHAGYKLVYEPSLFVKHYPSTANRDQYRGWLIASQVYAGLKRQWLYRGGALGAVAFGAFAVPRLLLFQLRRSGLSAFIASTMQACRGIAYFLPLLHARNSRLGHESA